MKSVVSSQTVNWTGENPYIWLYDESETEIITAASFFRVLYSRYGKGHVLFLRCDVQGDGFAAPEDLCVCLTDNRDLAHWLKEDIVSLYTGFRDRPEYATMLIIQAEHFQASGDPKEAWTESIRGGGLEIVLRWENPQEPFYAEIPPSRWPFVLVTVLIPARSAAVTISGMRVAGRVKAMDFHGRESTSCCLAFSETWLEAKGT
ncbi:MAG: hypothetical protein M5U01_20725 [Ardenticatenaceae bacterium]|nr:hypothetical protein [Ardenticatenaceae bacterium]